jgi:hypothetical protein
MHQLVNINIYIKMHSATIKNITIILEVSVCNFGQTEAFSGFPHSV